MDKASFKLLILHEDELRKAARLLQVMLDAQESGEGFTEAAHDALNACIVALHGMHDQDEYPIAMVSSTRRLLGQQATP